MRIIQDRRGETAYEISKAAYQEKVCNFKEVHGFGIGFARVTHPDWRAIAQAEGLHRRGDQVTITAYTPDGRVAACGCLARRHDDNTLEYSG